MCRRDVGEISGCLPVEGDAQLDVPRRYVAWGVARDCAALGEGGGRGAAVVAVVLVLARVAEAAEVAGDEEAG